MSKKKDKRGTEAGEDKFRIALLNPDKCKPKKCG